MSDTAIVQVRDLTRRFGQTTALDRVSLEAAEGRVLGLVGENGAGKTTLLKHVLGTLRAEQGEVRVFGKDPVAEPVEVLGRLGYLSEDRDLPGDLRIGQLIDFTRAFYPNWDRSFEAELLEMFELNPRQGIQGLSRGQAARVGLLLALAHRPPLLVLDEPSSGLDPVARRDILAAIIRTVADEGRTVLFSSHLLDEVQRVADHVVMLDRGQVVVQGELDEVLGAHLRLTVRFAEPQDKPPSLDAALSCEGAGREWTVVCNGKREHVEQQVAALQGEILQRERPTLDEVFVARRRLATGSSPAGPDS